MGKFSRTLEYRTCLESGLCFNVTHKFRGVLCRCLQYLSFQYCGIKVSDIIKAYSESLQIMDQSFNDGNVVKLLICAIWSMLQMKQNWIVRNTGNKFVPWLVLWLTSLYLYRVMKLKKTFVVIFLNLETFC